MPHITHQGHAHDASHDDPSSKVILGFWLYLMTDAILFATLFATYAVLQNATFGGYSARDFGLSFALMETFVLLASSFTSGIAQVAANRENKRGVIFWLVITFILGALFLAMIGMEWNVLLESGNTWERSAFLSAYYVLVATLLAHIAGGLLWILVLIALTLQRGLIPSTHRRFTCFRLFWHFLNIVWVFIFTFVYLIGAV